MMSVVIIIIGIILFILGARQIALFVNDVNRALDRLVQILESERFERVERLNDEMDELNYSYYEILDDVNERLIALEMTGVAGRRPERGGFTNVTHSQSDDIALLIDSGVPDREIAKRLGVGVGKVVMVRRTRDAAIKTQ